MIKEVLYSVAILAAVCSSHAQAVVLQVGDIIVGDRDRFGTVTSTIYRVDPSNGNREVISSSSVGTGDDLISANSLAIEQDGSILVVDRDSGAIIRIDPVTGNRTTLSSSLSGDSVPLVSPLGIAVASNGNIFVTDEGLVKALSTVLRIDPTTGNRTVVSSGTVGGGAVSFERPGALAFDASGNLYVTDDRSDSGADRIVQVNIANGDRTVVSVGPNDLLGTGDGASFAGLEGGLVALGNTTLYISDFGVNSIVEVDISSGDRTTLSSGLSSPVLSTPLQIALNAAGDLVVANSGADNLLLVDTSPGGSRSILSAGPPIGGVGTGTEFLQPLSLAIVQSLSNSNGAPEPASILLFATGLIWIAIRRPLRGRRA